MVNVIQLKNAIAEAQTLIHDDLMQAEQHLRALPGLQPESLRNAVEIIVASGGKRIRPIITLLVAGMMGFANSARLIYLASAAEMYTHRRWCMMT